VRAAAAIGVRHVITTEGDPKTAFGHGLSEREALFTIREKLHEPLRVAEDHGVSILLEPHGRYTDSVDHMEHLLEACDSPALGINLDTGNLWLGGGDPVEMVRRLGQHIQHVHWKDMPAELEPQRGSVYGTGMAAHPTRPGRVDIEGTFRALQAAGFDGHTTLEIAGDEAVLASRAVPRGAGGGLRHRAGARAVAASSRRLRSWTASRRSRAPCAPRAAWWC
jgi:inosose dehydratase